MTALAVPEGLEPLAVCRHCGQRIARCREGCNWSGWFHPGRFADLAPLAANDAHYCAGADGTLAEPPVIVPLTELPPAHLLKG